MNKFYANGTPVLNSLAVQTDKPLDAREFVLDLAERDELVSKHLAYDKMRVHVKSNDTIYIYDKDNNKWIEDNYFSEDDKNKLDNIDEYLVNTTILYDIDKTLIIRKHSYNPSTDVTRLFDEKLQEAKVTEDGDLYNGLISKFYINRLNNITNYLINREFTTKEGDTGLYSTVSRFNTDTKEITKEDLKIPVATDENDGLLSNIQNIKLNRIKKYVDDIDIKHTNVSNIGLQYSYNVYNPNTNENTTYTITIPLSTDSENGLMSNIEHTKLGRIIDYMTEIGTYNQDESGLKYVYKTFNPNTNIESEHDLIIPLSTHDLNGLLSNIDKIKLDDIESFLTNIELIESTDSEDLKLRLHITNPNTQQDTTSEFILPLVTDTHNGLVSPDIKHWIDQAKGLSTTGTTSNTWQLSKKDIDTKLDPNGGAILKSKDGAFEARNATDTDYTGLTVKDLVIKGNVTQEGDTFITEAETVEISDNTLVINKGETGAGVTKGIAGLIIDRGTSPDYQIIFDEKDDRFKAGEEGDLWCLALRDNDADLVDGYFTTWDAATKRLKTTNIIPDGKALYFGSNDYYITKYSGPSSDGLNIKLNLAEFNLYNNYRDIYLENVNPNYSFIIKNALKVEGGLIVYKDNPNSSHYALIANNLLRINSDSRITMDFSTVSSSSITTTFYYHSAYKTLGEFTFNSNNINGFIIKSIRPSQGGGTINHLATEEWVVTQKLPVPNSLTWQDSSNVKQSFDGSEEKNLTLWRATHVGNKNYEGYVVAWNNTDITRPDDPTNNAKWIKIKFPYKYSNNVPFQFTLDGFVNYFYFKIFCSGYLYYNEQNIYYPDIQIINLANSSSLGLKLNVKLGVDSAGYGVLFILNFSINNNVWGLTIHDFNSSWNTKDWTTGWEISYSPDPDDTYKWALEKTLYDTVKEDELQTTLGKYLPLAGGTMTGAITLSSGSTKGLLTTGGTGLLYYDTTNTYLSDWSKPTIIRSTATDLKHRIFTNSSTFTDYSIWDSNNLPDKRTVKTSYPDKVLSNFTSGNWYRICRITGFYKAFLLSINHYTYSNFNPKSHLFSISIPYIPNSAPGIKMLSPNTNCFYNKIRLVYDNGCYIDICASESFTGNNVYASFIGDGVNDIEFILELSSEPSTDAKVYEFNISDIEVITNSQLLAQSGKYLPLTGGTLTGALTVNSTIKTSGLITATNGVQIGSVSDVGWFNNSNRICAGMSSAKGVNAGSLLVSDKWADATNVPTNGIYSSGNILSNSYFLNNRDIVRGNYGFGILYRGVRNTGKPYLGLGSTYSTGYLQLYCGIRPKSNAAGYEWANLPDSVKNGSSLELSESGYLTLKVASWSDTKPTEGSTATTTNYKVWTEKELLNPKFAYGFEYLGSPSSSKPIDLNTIFDNTLGGAIYCYDNYSQLLNKPNDMRYGSVYQLGINNKDTEHQLQLQIAADVKHAENNSKTGRLWYRMPGSSGLATAGWKRVLTAEDDLPNILTKEKADTYYYPLNGKGCLSFTSEGNPLLENNQGIWWKDSDGKDISPIWLNTGNNLVIGKSNSSIGTFNNILIRGNLKTETGLNDYLYNYYDSPKFLTRLNLYASKTGITTGGWARAMSISEYPEATTRTSWGAYGSAGTFTYSYFGVLTGNESYDKVNTLKLYLDNITFGNKSLAVWGAESNALTKLLYNRTLTINGTGWSVVGTASGNMSTIYAPTSVGSSGQFLKSTGGVPSWVNLTPALIGAAAASHTHTLAQISDLHSSWDAVLKAAPSYLSLSGGKMTGAINATNLDLIKLKYGSASNAISGLKWIAHDSNTVLSEIGALNTAKRIYLIPDLGGYASPWDGTKGLSIEASTIKFNGSTLAKVSDITWNNLSGKPSSFTPASHTHSASNITSGTLALARIPTGTSSSTVALGNHTHSNYASSSHTHNRLTVEDNRDTTLLPNNMGSSSLRTFFNQQSNMPNTNWWAGIHVSGWTGAYAAWELAGPAYNSTPAANALYFRTGVNITWNEWKRVAFSDEIPTWSTLSGKPSSFSTSISNITDLNSSWDSILKNAATSATFTPKAHNQASNTITTMTGYTKGSLTSAIATSDSLNTAIGKLELRIDGKLTTTSSSAGQATQVMVVTQLPTAPQANTLYLIVE